jgi:NAD(P)H-nitrite reductase large subunit
MIRKPVFMCVCSHKTFADILKIAREKGINCVEELKEKKVCGMSCQMCTPYVAKALITGETSFNPGDVYSKSG